MQDWGVFVYLGVLWLAAFQGAGPQRGYCLSRLGLMLGVFAATMVLVRGGLLRGGYVAPVAYRLVVWGGIQLSYFLLRDLLPTAVPYAFDQQLYRLDVRLFSLEPTLLADHFVAPATTEWFSFFYFSYFFLLGAHVLPFLFVSRRLHLFAEFSLAMFLVFCTAHVLYMVVPGYGPYRHLAGLYTHEALPRGFWYDLVLDAVSTGGAQKDIFPSLHTAAPTMLAIFSFRHRDQLPFKYTWPVVAFWALNIIGATIFLRWHYLIDVVAGLTLATTATLLAGRISPREEASRQARGLPLTWPAFPHRAPVDRPATPAETVS